MEIIDGELSQPVEDPSFRPWGMELKSYLMLMHLSQLAGMMVPFAGIVLPIVMWSTNKDQSPQIDQHGKNILNWMISSFIYAIACIALIFLFVGIFLIIALAICSLVFTILGAVKANEGKLYEYPMTIKFIK